MNKTPRLGYWWPLVFGTTIGVETMLSVLVLFGPAPIKPEIIEQLTEKGRAWYNPEHDLAIYVAGCVVTALLVGCFSWLWQRRLASVPDAAHDKFIRRGCAHLSVAVALFLLHLGLVLAFQRWWLFKVSMLPLFPIFGLAAPVIASLMVATIGASWDLGVAPRRLVRLLAAPPALYEVPRISFEPWFDIIVAILLCMVIYVPQWRNLAGQFFLHDGFQHWDFFTMGPTLAFHHGKALVTEAYTEHGVGRPILFSALSGLIPITYGRFIQVAVIYGCIYFIGVYAFLRLALGRGVWAVAGVMLALSLQLFHGLSVDEVLWNFPSSTVVRSAMDVWFFIALLLHLRSHRAAWTAVAGAFVGLAILFQTDTGIYLAIVFAAYWVFALGIAGQPQPSVIRRLRSAVNSFVVTALVLLAGLAVASRGTLWRRDFWAGWLEPLLSHSGGMAMLPVAFVPTGTLLFFAVIILVYFGAMGLALLKLLRRESTPSDVLVGCLASYGLLVLILFVGRSHPFNIFHPSVPFSLLVTIMVARLHKSFQKWAYADDACNAATRAESGQNRQADRSRRLRVHKPIQVFNAARREGAAHGFWKSLESLAPWCVLSAVMIWLLANPAFQNYPGMLRTIFSGTPAEGVCLLRDPRDVCGLPAETEGYVDATVSRLRALVAAGQTVAVLDDIDTIFYLAGDARPWWRFSPCFQGILRRSELDELQRAIVSRGPQCILIRPDGHFAELFREEDVWRAVHQTVESCYRLEDTTGIFEIWRRNEK